ncbi:putative bifunctional diguanylate cyclase/phosphodiesterase [Allorhizobium undicola]|uniref:putative bifunctional diguanylate cyclase/phosphodiesterase n=1 Tax=Allorhizobium undicola TaxID=78527 RepID=UPI0012B52FAE|nr:EAL domain-containing protein [Allorhizobium undicola]
MMRRFFHRLLSAMVEFSSSLHRRLAFHWPAIIVCTAVFGTTIYVDQQQRHSFMEDSRATVSERLATLRARLEGNLRTNMKLVQALSAYTEAENNLGRARFEQLSKLLLTGPSQLKSFSLVGPSVGVFTFPPAPKGLPEGYYDEAEEKEAQKATARRTATVTGPVLSPSGARVFRIFQPLILDEPRDDHSFYSTLIGTVDAEELFRSSGLLDSEIPIDIALYSPGRDNEGQMVFGDPGIVGGMTVNMDVNFGAQSWTLAAAPHNGWQVAPVDLWHHRIIMMLLAMAVITPVLWVASLLRERHDHIAVLNHQRAELRTLSKRLHIALRASKIGVWELDTETETLNFDDRMREFYDIDASRDLRLADWVNAIHPDDVEDLRQALKSSVRGRSNFSAQFRVIGKDGELRYLRAFGTTYRDALAKRKVVGVHWNVTDDVQLQQALSRAKQDMEAQNRALEDARRAMEHASLHDPLTGLGNRRFLDTALQTLEQQGRCLEMAVLHIDLDRFKEINDTLGHAAGDDMLKHVASQVQAMIETGDIAARIGGDEFVLVVDCKNDRRDIRRLAEALIAAINRPLTCMDQECRIGASIGVARPVDNAASSMARTLVNADIALYEAKRRGKNRMEVFNEQLKTATLATKKTGDAILRSLETQDFIAHYQPQFDARTLEIVGVEALARWRHPERGLLAPSEFLSVAESLNVVAMIDKTILEQTLGETRRWQDAGFQPLHVSVNISAQRLFDSSLISRLQDLRLPPGGLTFELLESISFDDRDETAATTINRIKALGIDVEIDDFGTGYSSILSLLKLSPRRLKIDRQLILPVPTSKQLRRLIGSVVEIGRALGIEIVAEGVETMRHAEILRDLGCQTLQGYALARPMSADDLFQLLAERHRQGDGRIIA